MSTLKSSRKTVLARTVLLLGGAAAVLIGVYRGEVQTVLMKAVYICLECIGIG